MKKLFASASYSFNNFYNNLNTQGQMVFTLIMTLILILCALLLITYIIQGVQYKVKLKKIKEASKQNINKEKKEIIIEKKEQHESLYTNEKTEIEDIANAISNALEEEKPITLTNFEEDQEKTAIISIDELMKKAKELELIDDEDHGNVNYLEKYNLEPAEVEAAVSNTINVGKDAEVKAFKVSQVISPIYGVKKDILNDK